jgi:20S proteasome alpha/beta subunit
MIYNHTKYNIRRLIEERPAMTYILAARCSDGVVLVADKRFTINGGIDYEYDKKLLGEFFGVIIGFAGIRGTFEIFKTNIIDYVKSAQARNERVSIEQFLLKVSEITHKLSTRYGRYYEILLGIRSNPSSLYYVYADGQMEPVNRYKAIGNGWSFGSIYLKQNWNKEKTMEQVAELGYFILKYIQHFNLDRTVGVDTNDTPQIWFIPDNKDDYCATPEQLTCFEQTTQIWLKNVETNTLLSHSF